MNVVSLLGFAQLLYAKRCHDIRQDEYVMHHNSKSTSNAATETLLPSALCLLPISELVVSKIHHCSSSHSLFSIHEARKNQLTNKVLCTPEQKYPVSLFC